MRSRVSISVNTPWQNWRVARPDRPAVWLQAFPRTRLRSDRRCGTDPHSALELLVYKKMRKNGSKKQTRHKVVTALPPKTSSQKNSNDWVA